MSSAADQSELIKLFQKTHLEALRKNQENVEFWTARKTEYTGVKSQLETLPDKLSHDVMVPVGTKALMRGKIVHTNEILVCLGDGWFVKQSAKLAGEICERRIKACDEMLASLEKERALLASRKQLPIDEDAFGNEIMEPYDETAESEWRVRHRQKEQDYRQQLARQRKDKENKEVETIDSTDDDDKEFWNRLELLELQEEMEGELDKVREKAEQTIENVMPIACEPPRPIKTSPQADAKLKRRVSFVEEPCLSNDLSDNDDSDSSDEPLSIEFSHTPAIDSTQLSTDVEDVVTSPSDIYKLFPKAPVKSILKTQSNRTEVAADTAESPERWMDYESGDRFRGESLPVVFGDVIEHSVDEEVHVEQTNIQTRQRVSRFKAARQSSKKGHS